jgi:hypothetical protein
VEGYEAWVTGLWPIQLEVGGEEEEVRFDLARLENWANIDGIASTCALVQLPILDS